MTFSTNVSSGMAQENLHAAANRLKQKDPGQENQGQQHRAAEQQRVKQPPSATALEWVAVEPAAQAHSSSQVSGATRNTNERRMEIATARDEDIAVLSSTVSTNGTEVSSVREGSLTNRFMRRRWNAGELESSFRDTFRGSKSHNLLLERFKANVKMSGISMMMSLCGVDAKRIEEIKNEVRCEVLRGIDTKLSQDWAYAKAMLDIMG